MNNKRLARFTSSQIGKLMTYGKDGKSFGKPALTYIEEKQMEKKSGRFLNSETSSRPTSWGKLVEQQAFNLLGLEYKITSEDTIIHPDIPLWVGSPDGVKEDTVFDIKCPYTLKSFFRLVACKTIDEVRAKCDDGELYYWQLVSNAILTDKRYAELIVYCPYKEELDDIRELASNFDGNQNKYAWIGFGADEDLPHIIKGNHYNNLNIIRFEVSEEDKKALFNRVIESVNLFYSTVLL